MTESYPSKRAVVVDVPDVQNINHEFVYNFFTLDEQNEESALISVSASMPNVFKTLSQFTTTNNSANSSNFLKYIPRYIKLTWNPTTVGSIDLNDVKSNANQYSVESLYKQNLIYNEETFATEEYKNISFQDTQQDEKMRYFVQNLVANLIQSRPEINKPTISQQDLIAYVNKYTSKNVTPDFLSDVIGDMNSAGYSFPKDTTGDNRLEIQNTVLAQMASVRTDIQINKKFLYSVLQTVRENPISIYADEFSNRQLEIAKQIQENAIKNNPSNIIKNSDYDTDMEKIIDVTKMDANYFESKSSIIGYLIEKCEYTSNNKEIIHDPFFVESPFVGSTFDWEVKYGSTYQYRIASVATFTMRSVNVDTSQVLKVTFAVRSKFHSTKMINCIEKVPPPPPADFNIHWDYDTRKPVLTWSLPVNSQRDIKYFQVFRRKTIKDPYELLVMYDFNDSHVKSPVNEFQIRGLNSSDSSVGSLILKTNSPMSFYIDEEFSKDTSNYIYSVCSVDAHGYSSNYGPQVEISFDKFTNKLKKKLISKAGAPKPYPNYMILQDLFQDTIKVSSADSFKVYFNPEFIKVYKTRKDGTNNKDYLPLIKTENNTYYKLQMINLDLQKQQVFSMQIKNYIDNPPTETNILPPDNTGLSSENNTSG